MKAVGAYITTEFIEYLAEFINEELTRKHKITKTTILNALEAFNNGAGDKYED